MGLKKLICTCYAGSPVVYTQLSLFGDDDQELHREESEKKPYKIEITHVDDLNGDGAVDLTENFAYQILIHCRHLDGALMRTVLSTFVSKEFGGLRISIIQSDMMT